VEAFRRLILLAETGQVGNGVKVFALCFVFFPAPAERSGSPRAYPPFMWAPSGAFRPSASNAKYPLTVPEDVGPAHRGKMFSIPPSGPF